VCTWCVSGGFASYLLGLNRKTYELTGVGVEGNNPNTVRDPGFGWMTAFLFVVCFVGLFILIPLRKVSPSPLQSYFGGFWKYILEIYFQNIFYLSHLDHMWMSFFLL